MMLAWVYRTFSHRTTRRSTVAPLVLQASRLTEKKKSSLAVSSWTTAAGDKLLNLESLLTEAMTFSWRAPGVSLLYTDAKAL